MKLMHLSDLHLGKMLKQYNLISLQKELLGQITQYIRHHEIDGIIIAGDIYDHHVPSQEAVNILDAFLNELIVNLHKKVYAISGNHDSPDRLNFASSILASQGLYIETRLKEQMVYIEEGDVRIYLLPYFKPALLHALDEEAPLHNYNDAMKHYLNKQVIDPNYKNILVTHQFVGHASQTSDSEMSLSVGDSEVIDPELFAQFDYVALGHLHAPQYVNRPTIRYAGSLMRYSFDECRQHKSVTIIDTDDFSLSFMELIPSKQVTVFRDTFSHLLSPDESLKRDDLLAIELLDDHLIPHAIEQLRVLYPHVLSLTYPQLLARDDFDLRRIEKVEKMDPVELFVHFYQDMTSHDLDDESRTIVTELLEGGMSS